MKWTIRGAQPAVSSVVKLAVTCPFTDKEIRQHAHHSKNCRVNLGIGGFIRRRNDAGKTQFINICNYFGITIIKPEHFFEQHIFRPGVHMRKTDL